MKAFPLEDDGHCFACGENNPSGLKLKFRREKEKTIAEFVAIKSHQGFKNIVHGGIIAAVLDEAMMKTALGRGIKVMTAEINVRFSNPLFTGETAVVEAELIRTHGRLVEASAVVMRDGTVLATGRAKMLRHA